MSEMNMKGMLLYVRAIQEGEQLSRGVSPRIFKDYGLK